jgi:hypothetical protein
VVNSILPEEEEPQGSQEGMWAVKAKETQYVILHISI